MSKPAVFFDRDDTLNLDPGYLGDPAKLKLIPGVKEGLTQLRERCGFKIIVITNQSGITRGLISEVDVENVNNHLNSLLNNIIDDFFYCPFHPDFDPPEKSKCRKPSAFMILQASKKHDIDLTRSYLVGDSVSDVECAINAGIKSVLFDYKNDVEKINLLKNLSKSPNFVATKFLDACNYIIADYFGETKCG